MRALWEAKPDTQTLRAIPLSHTQKRGNMRLVSVVMKSINGAYADTAALLDYGFNNFTRTAVKTEPETMSVSYLPAGKIYPEGL